MDSLAWASGLPTPTPAHRSGREVVDTRPTSDTSPRGGAKASMLRLPVPGLAFRGHSAPQILLGRRLHPGEVVIAGGDARLVNIYAVDASGIQS